METAPCWLSMCCAKSYPRKPNLDNSNSLCWDTSAPSVCAFGVLPVAAAAAKKFVDGTLPGDGRLGDSPTLFIFLITSSSLPSS